MTTIEKTKAKKSRNRELAETLWHLVADGSSFEIVRTPLGWDGKLSIHGVEPFTCHGHTPYDVVRDMIYRAVKAAKGESE